MRIGKIVEHALSLCALFSVAVLGSMLFVSLSGWLLMRRVSMAGMLKQV